MYRVSFELKRRNRFIGAEFRARVKCTVNRARYVHTRCARVRRHTCAASTRALKNHRAGIDNFTSMEVERNREAKIDLYSSFVGWLTNAVERDGGEVEWWASSVNGQKPIRCRSGIECRARCRPRFIV